MISRQTACSLGALVLILYPATPFARTNKVTTGLSTSYDYSDRQYDPVTGDPTPESITNTSDDDYNRLVLQPLFSFVSDSQVDHFKLRAAPSIKYDLSGDQTDWDNDLFLSAERSLSKAWQLNVSNAFLRSDYHDPQSGIAVDTGTQDSQNPTPELSTDLGRTRYWRNTLKGGAKYIYGQESLVNLGGDFIVLRNDDAETLTSYEDYDRYAVNLNNEHRFNNIWKTIAELSFVRGDYAASDTTTPDVAPTSTTDNLSGDLKEYHLLATVENNYFQQNKVSLNYNYIGTRYDEDLKDNGDIHQSRLTWRRDFSQKLNTTLGAGPSYEKTEGRDANWGGNGLAEINYLIQHGSFTFAVEKRYDVDNFSGTDERGFIDYWDTRFLFNYQLVESVTLNGRIAYRYEDREDPDLLTYHKDLITTGLGLHYSFLQYYSAGLNYTFTKQISDRIGDDYDDHRLLFALSWEQEWLRW
ncbi:MAG: hypothetical protein KJ915_13955 [Candidatus Omnitrophica bacterium]|nr:hypothetical protein [Candidatus Omnitrophota bacterium]